MLRRIEQALERVIDGGLSRLGGVAVHPLEIARRLQARMDDSLLVSTGDPRVPNRYTVRLHDDDLRAMSGVVRDVAEQIAGGLEEYAAESGWVYGEGVRVNIVGGGERAGQIEVEHAFDETPPAARLVVVWGEPADAVFEVGRGVTIGRDPECEVVLSDPAISRRQARIEWTYGGYMLYDLDSRNGTFVNDERVSEAALLGGDILQVGTTQLRLAADRAPATGSA
ncbi:MAG TPA: DUF3662 and FHA domain-containing protein [Armatimonadota bacterium]|nr:DUF3662 and FHA domain-containing protein [Armatimonadota bacterium]